MAQFDSCRPLSGFATRTLWFGPRVRDVVAGADAALGQSFLQVKFVNTASGAPLPDLEQLFFAPEPSQEFPSFIQFTALADGTLRAAFGVADGTSGRATVTRTDLLITACKGATADAFPAECIDLQVVGKQYQVFFEAPQPSAPMVGGLGRWSGNPMGTKLGILCAP